MTRQLDARAARRELARDMDCVKCRPERKCPTFTATLSGLDQELCRALRAPGIGDI